MRKFFSVTSFVLMAAMVLSLSGCGGSSHSGLGSGGSSSATVEQVAVVSSPALVKGESYQIYRGATFSNMGSAKYYVAPGGSEANKAGMNLGLKKALASNESLAIVKNGTTEVVYAYNPSGTDDAALSTGTVTLNDNGTLLQYSGHRIGSVSPSFFTAMDVDTSSAKTITLNGSTATFDGSAVASFDYVWHVSPDHKDEYYTLGINGTTEYTEDDVLEAIGDKTVYIAHDIRYTPNYLNFTGTVQDDDETEYAAYYTDAIAAELKAELGDAFGGPYIFATLPQSGMSAAPGQNGQQPGTPPDQNSGNGQPSGTPPDQNGGNGQRPGTSQMPGMPEMPGRQGNGIRSAATNSEIAYFSSMTHSPSDAYSNPVLHITKAGTYTLKGTWNGQIWIDAGEEENDKVTVILDNVTVTCGVAPAIVFHDLYECGPDDEDTVSANDTWKTVGNTTLDNAGAKVIIADDSTNTFTGANVYRLLKAQKKKDSVTAIDGTDLDQQKKRYKMDGAFYSFVSMAIGGGSKANGVLNIKSTTFEGLDTEMHLTIESGTVTVYGHDDGINVNEDDVSVFSLLGGSLKVTSEVGDGIDSNGYVYFSGGSLDITAGSQKQNSAGEAGIDAEKSVYIYNDNAYTWSAYSGSTGTNTGTGTDNGSGTNTGNGTGSETGNNTGNETNSGTGTVETEKQVKDYGTVYINQSTSQASGTAASLSVTTSYGTTTSTISGSTSAMLDTSGATYPSGISGDVFTLDNTNNTFAGITAAE